MRKPFKIDTTLNDKQREFLELLPIGEQVDVATSEYSLTPIESTGWNPHYRTSHKTIYSLTLKGYIESCTFWRGATVKRLK